MSTKTRPLPPRAQDLTRTEKRNILLSMECPKCAQGAGHACKSPGGGFTQTHRVRYEAVSKAGLIAW